MVLKMKKKNYPRQKIKLLSLWLLFIILGFGNTADIAFSTDLPIIPGAAGWGITTPAGRGGEVYRVTNLKASGPVSLRAALEESSARVVVNDVPDESKKPPAPKNLRIISAH